MHLTGMQLRLGKKWRDADGGRQVKQYVGPRPRERGHTSVKTAPTEARLSRPMAVTVVCFQPTNIGMGSCRMKGAREGQSSLRGEFHVLVRNGRVSHMKRDP